MYLRSVRIWHAPPYTMINHDKTLPVINQFADASHPVFFTSRCDASHCYVQSGNVGSTKVEILRHFPDEILKSPPKCYSFDEAQNINVFHI